MIQFFSQSGGNYTAFSNVSNIEWLFHMQIIEQFKYKINEIKLSYSNIH